MNRLSSCFLLGAVLLSSCNKQETAAGNTVDMVLNVQGVQWNAGDAVSVYDGVSNNRFVASESGQNASFAGRAVAADRFLILYPYSGEALFNGKEICTSLPELQPAIPGSFAGELNICAAIAGEGSGTVRMNNACCFFRFAISGEGPGIASVAISATGGEYLCGKVHISFDSENTPVMHAVSGSSSVRMTSPSAFGKGEYVFVISPTTLSKGLSLAITGTDGNVSRVDFPNMTAITRTGEYSFDSPLDEGDVKYISNEGITDEVFLAQAGNEDILKERTPWNCWTDAASLRDAFVRAAAARKVYFSNFKYYDCTVRGSLVSPKSEALGYPFLYSEDFYEASGTYFPESHRQEVRKNLVRIVKSAWEKNRSVPFMSWHLESPYAVYETFGQQMGCRYTYLEEGFPQKHRWMIHEILENAKVDTLGITYMGDWFDERCRDVADIINEFTDKDGRAIPFVFRLWHEQEDSWAWWDYNHHVTIEDYKAFWHLTVEKFRKYCPTAQILFGYGPDRYFETETKYMISYPGDDVVDIVGYDDYNIGEVTSFASEQATIDASTKRGRIVSKVSAEHGKPAVLFETNNKCTGYQDVYYSKYVKALLQDPQVSLSVFQIWSDCYNQPAQKPALEEFIKEDYIIFGE